MKILHILDHSIPLHSGYTFRTRAILQQQRAMGWQTDHVTSTKHIGAQADVETVDGLTFYRSPALSALVSRIPVYNQWAVVKSLEHRLDQIIPELKPDILHAHSPALNGLAAVKMAKKYQLPLVYECRAFWEDAAVDHGTTSEGSLRYRVTKWLETRVFQQADAVTTICQGLRNDIISRGIAADKITVIANAVDIEQFPFNPPVDQALKQELGLQDKTVLGFIGSFYAYEGLLLLLDALPTIVQAQPDTRLLLVGGGPQQDAIKAKIAELNLQDVVILTGRVPHDQVARYYSLVDLFVYPRLSMRLTELVTPLKPLEAMAQGRLLLASDVGGHHELINHQQTGYLFKAGDADALAQAALQALADRSRWPQIRDNARRFVEQERNWPVSVAHYQDVYARILAQ